MSRLFEGTTPISKSELFEVWCEETVSNKRNSCVLTHVLEKLNVNEDTETEKYKQIKSIVSNFTSNVNKRWNQCYRNKSKFISRHSEWLKGNINIPNQEDFVDISQPSTSQVGRPLKEFANLNEKTKKRKIMPLLEKYNREELTLAARASLYSAGKRDAASVVKEITQNSPERATKLKKAFHSPLMGFTKYTTEEALALYVDGNYTKQSYILMQSGAKSRNADIYPSYEQIKKGKKECYPPDEFIKVTDTSAEVELQPLLNHTIERLAQSQFEVLNQNITSICTAGGLKAIYKWGCDGSAGHSNYKQKFTDTDLEDKSDSNLFAVCIVPLQLVMFDNNTILWHNPQPSSTRFCRPIKVLFEKETADLIQNETLNIERQIAKLNCTEINIRGQNVRVTHCLKMTMIDSKSFGVLTQTSSQTCGICEATPKIMNDHSTIYKRPSKTSRYEFGLSNLHAYIRCFECLLHICYRLNIKKWQIRSQEDKQIFEASKKVIREKLKTEMALLVDIPKPGYGTSNDGNTARRFFSEYTQSAILTGIDEGLIKRFSVILQTISCSYSIDVEAFRKYCKDTAQKYVDLYPWYPMPSSVHKLLIHGADIVEAAILPIGMMSEEAIEARNKDFRKYREQHTRKFSRENTMRDLLNLLLCSSDPVISSISVSNQSYYRSFKNKSLNADVIQLLKTQYTSTSTSEEDADSDTDYDI